MEKKKVVISYEVLSAVISKIGVLTTNDNKVRFNIGNKDSGNGLPSIATIVSGGAMVKVGFLTLAPKKPVDLTEQSPYMHFILKAKDFVTYAGALLPYKADVTVTEEGDRVIFSCLEGTKVPVNKVGVEAAEPLLEEDFGARTAQVMGESFMDTLEKGGFSSTLAGSDRDTVTVKIEDGKMDVYSVATAGGSHFNCNVEVKMSAPADSGACVDAKTFLINHAKTLGNEEEQNAFKAELAAVVNEPGKISELAKSLGWTENAGGVPEGEKAVKFALSGVNWRLMTRLYGGNKTVAAVVTPKNLHMLGGNVRATFALSTLNETSFRIFDQLDRIPKNVRMVVDKETFLGSLSLMKLGEKNKPCLIKAAKTALGLEKHGAGITGRVAFVASEGDLSEVKGAYDSELLSSVVSSLKAGNVLLRYTSADVPIYVSNGNLEADGVGYHALLGVKLPASEITEAEAPKATDPATASETE